MTQIATTSSTTTTVSSSTTATVSSPSAANIVHPYLLGPFGGADFDPTTFLATTELNYTEVSPLFWRFQRGFRRSGDPMSAKLRLMVNDERVEFICCLVRILPTQKKIRLVTRRKPRRTSL